MSKTSLPASRARRTLLGLAAIAVSGLHWPLAAASEPSNWPTPNVPIRIVVTQGAGAGSDLLARLVANEMQGVLNHPVIVENRPGAAGTLGHAWVAKAPPDGNTLILSSTGLLLVTPEITEGVRVPYTDFDPIAGINEAAYVVMVPNTPDAPKTLDELRQRIAAGPTTYGSSGVGTMAHLTSSLILLRAGLTSDHVPYKANAQVLQDLVGERLTFASDSVASARALLQSGRLRALAVTSQDRLKSLPDVPTLAEAGLPDTVVVTKAGLLAPRGTPPEVIQRLAEAVKQPLEDPRFIATLAESESMARYVPPAEYAKELEADARLWGDLVTQMQLRPR